MVIKNRNNSSSKKAFTTGELLITMTIIGVLAVISVKAVMGIQEKQQLQMYKKVFFQTEQLVNNIINDENFYSNGTFADNEDLSYRDNDIPGDNKFCHLFALHMKTTKNVYNCELTETAFEDEKIPTEITFTTADKISWILNTNYENFTGGTAQILVDLNGEKKPNKNQEDRFAINISSTGAVTPTTDLEKSIINED